MYILVYEESTSWILLNKYILIALSCVLSEVFFLDIAVAYLKVTIICFTGTCMMVP